MSDRIEPNPHSPYATAAPQVRHVFLTLSLFGPPLPGVLALTGCEHLAVVPDELTELDPANPAEGMCPDCMDAVNNRYAYPVRVKQPCQDCSGDTPHGTLCIMCRMDRHDQWRAAQ